MKRFLKIRVLKIRDWFVGNRRVLIFLGLVLFANLGVMWVFGWHRFVLGWCIYIAYYAITHRNSLSNIRIEDVINPLKWGSVLYASFMKMLFPMHIVEQLILRMYDMECRKCMANGSCFHCGCDMSKVFTPWDVCSQGNWGPMIEDKKEYEELRKEYPVEITVKYGRSNG